MVQAGRRRWRLFYWIAALLITAEGCPAQSPTLTTISDTVYRADGSTASGTLLISWPAFSTADGHAVAAGNTGVALGANGSFSVQLAPNSGAAPSAVVYTVVYQLTDGTVKTENWSVGTTSPETIAQVRTTVSPAPNGGSQFATQAYVNSALANVVHLNGSETITGTKQFSVAPILPSPSQAGQAVNKAYVDASVANTGSGSYVAKSGDTMTGPLTLPSDPNAPSQASTKHYVDVSSAAKADLVSGKVPTSELGTGTANNGACLRGDSTWGGCGASNGLTPGMQAIKYATDFAWSQTNTADLTTAGVKTVMFTICPPGVSGAEPQYYIYISGTGTAEAVLVTGGTCAGNGQPGTLQFTTANAHAVGYMVGSASGGLQEALVAARFIPSNPAGTSQSGEVIVPPGELKAYAKVSIRASDITVDFSGSIVECWMNSSCIFVGDGFTSRFYLSQTPFTKRALTVFDEEYSSTALSTTRWSVKDPASVVTVSGGTLHIEGGTGADGATRLAFAEQIELGGAWDIEHGDVTFSGAGSGILGGLYIGPVSKANCLAGFQVSPSGVTNHIQALVNGAATGAPLVTTSSHHYVLSTRIASREIFRQQEVYHSASYPAGEPVGGAQVQADVRIVLEVHDIDPTNPASMVAPATVLYDGVIAGAPAYCTYALVNSASLRCAIAFTRLVQCINVEVRSALPGQNFETRIVGPMSGGGECTVISGSTLDFFSSYVPVLNQAIEVHYRSERGNDPYQLTLGRAMARVTNPSSISAEQRGNDDGVRAVVCHLKSPVARTSVDCENAALALVTDGAIAPCKGKYQCWSDFLPGVAQDIFPGDGLNVNVPSRQAVFQAIVTEVVLTIKDLFSDHCLYAIEFEHAASSKFSFEFDVARTSVPLNLFPITSAQVGSTTLPSLTSAAITAVSSTTASIDAGVSPLNGGGVEVRWSDSGWGADNDQNLAGRFTAQSFTLPRLAKTQTYFLRQYDASTPPKYSRYSTALHIDYPY